ncbi:hypothetical protein Luutsna3_00028 [Pseudomonas phage vB_PpuP-Luutsna-3]
MRTFEVAPYGFRLHFCTVKKQAVAAYKEQTGKGFDADVAGCAWQNGLDFYLCVFDKGPACIDTLAHEIGHTLIDMCGHIGYNPSGEQEPYCYLSGWMTKTLMFAHPKFKEALNESS